MYVYIKGSQKQGKRKKNLCLTTITKRNVYNINMKRNLIWLTVNIVNIFSARVQIAFRKL